MDTGTPDRFSTARAVADALLYDGYVLCPYRVSPRQNQARWLFGVLAPRAFTEATGCERWYTRTECVVEAGQMSQLTIRIRCLQFEHRAVEALAQDGGDFVPIQAIEVDGRAYVEWDEGVDRIVDLAPMRLMPGRETAREEVFSFTEGQDTELIRSGDGPVVARVIRRRRPVDGRVRIATGPAEGDSSFVKVTVTVENSTSWSGTGTRRGEILDLSLVAVHTMLAVDGGVFVSLLDPPEAAVRAVVGCSNDGAFPVLIGSGDVMLSSSIILEDYPEVTLESRREFSDAPDIDEIRVPAAVDDERSQSPESNPAHASVDRIHRRVDLPPEIWERLNSSVDAWHPDRRGGIGLDALGE